jgi:hypothetical protein
MIRICGDVSLTDGYFDVGFGIGSLIKEGGNPLSNIDKGRDYWIGNFEGVTSDTSALYGEAALQFRIDPRFLDEPLKLFDVFGVANNHAMQHGDVAYGNTVKTLQEKGKKIFGSKTVKTTNFTVDGKQFSITGFSQRIDQFSNNPCYWHDPGYVELLEEINLIPQDFYKIVYVHWGNEFINRPSQSQVFFAHMLVDMGFDLVVGMHPHVLQGYEVYNSKYIFYSLGNFSFDMPWERTQYGAIINLTIKDGEVKINYDYIHIEPNLNTRIVEEQFVPVDYRFSTLNPLVSYIDNGEQYFAQVNTFYKQYRKANHRDILKKMFHHPHATIQIIGSFINRRIIKK